MKYSLHVKALLLNAFTNHKVQLKVYLFKGEPKTIHIIQLDDKTYHKTGKEQTQAREDLDKVWKESNVETAISQFKGF